MVATTPSALQPAKRVGGPRRSGTTAEAAQEAELQPARLRREGRPRVRVRDLAARSPRQLPSNAARKAACVIAACKKRTVRSFGIYDLPFKFSTNLKREIENSEKF